MMLPPRQAKPDGKRKTPRRATWALAFAGAVILFLGALWLLRTHVPETFRGTTVSETAPEQIPLVAFILYYPSAEAGGLLDEVRLLPHSGQLEADTRTVIEALLAGPVCDGFSPWPEEATIQNIFMSSEGIAYVNFSGSLRWLLPEGDYVEWSVLASLTRALCDNFATIRGVRVLVDGESHGALRRVMPLDWEYRPGMCGGGW